MTVTAVPVDGKRFLGWSDASMGNAATVTLNLDEAVNLTARFE